MRVKSKWGELSSAADEDDTANLKLKLKTEIEQEMEDEKFKTKFHMADLNIGFISKNFKDTMLPVESVRKD